MAAHPAHGLRSRRSLPALSSLRRPGSLGGLLGAAVLALGLAGPARAAGQDWVGAWGASPAFPVGQELNRQTVRQNVRISVGGPRVRVRFSNETGTQPLVIGSAHVAMAGEAGAIRPGSDHALTFGGQPSMTVPPGAPALSDPVDFEVHPLDTLAVSLFISRDTGPSVVHPLGRQTSYVSQTGDFTAAATIPDATTTLERPYLSRVDVETPGRPTRAIVTLGDSITDGYGSSVDADKRWPDRLAERLKGRPLAVVDAGISGNRVLHDLPEETFGPSALSRLDRDVLAVPDAAFLIVMEGINDIGHSGSADLPEQAVSAEQIIVGLKQIIARAHGQDMKVFGATLTPYEGTIFAGYYTPEGEAKREAVNDWIRTGNAFDGVIDFDAALRDPAHPRRVLPAYDFGDHLHPNDAGYAAMADSIDLDLFK